MHANNTVNKMRTKPTGKPHALFPRPHNSVVNDPTPTDQAVYVPSVTPGFAKDVFKNKWHRALPNGVTGEDLNFLAPNNNLFRISHVMSSAGQALKQTQDCIITTRNRKTTKLICDSGGYQIASGQLQIEGDADRLAILRWAENHGDLSMTLDVPTGPCIKDSNYPRTTDCLARTLDHLTFFQKNRRSANTQFLNVLQGNTLEETDVWYDAVKRYDFEGWAFAGVLRHNMFALCRRIITMIDDNQISKKTWIHVLGTNELDTAVMLTALQRAINKHVNPKLRISYDTSSAFRNLSWNQMFTRPNLTARSMTMTAKDAPDGPQFVGSQLPWVWQSHLGARMVLGDFCVPKPPKSTRYRDTQSNHYLAHHNLGALCDGIALVNRLFDCDIVAGEYSIASGVGDAVDAIDAIIAAGNMDTLRKHRPAFTGLRHSAKYADEDRAVFDD